VLVARRTPDHYNSIGELLAGEEVPVIAYRDVDRERPAADDAVENTGCRARRGGSGAPMLIIGALVCAGVLAAGPQGALAATVQGGRDTLVFSAQPGEANTVTVQIPEWAQDPDSLPTWIISDPGAPLMAAGSCSVMDAHTAACTGHELSMKLGDMDDALLITQGPGERDPIAPVLVWGNGGDDRLIGAELVAEFWLYGGPGNDVLDSRSQRPPDEIRQARGSLEGGQGDDQLIGTKGNDSLNPGSGADHVDGGAGRDSLNASGDRSHGAYSADVYIGGDGRDRISYGGRSTPVFVDLADDQPDGASGEGDRLTGIEDVDGGREDDVLAGDDGPNSLAGSYGRDQLIGRAGNDRLDTVGLIPPGPAGEDGEERVSCGPGEDRAILDDDVSARDFLTPDCEQISDVSGPIVSIFPTSRGTSLRYQVRCPRSTGVTIPGIPYRPPPCSGEIRATRPDSPARLLAYGSFPAGKRTNRHLTARLTRLGRPLTRRDRGVKAVMTLRLTIQDAEGPHTETIAWTTRLRR
jgi:Ca2+-binding RTX toxin-like protein